jgi:signal transduction histidine kinase
MKLMPSLKLYVKTSLPAALITVGLFVAALGLLSVGIANVIRDKEKGVARLQATELAEHVESFSFQRDSERLRESAKLIQSTHPNVSAVRIWQVDKAGNFTQVAASDEDIAAQTLSDQTKTSIRHNQKTETESSGDGKDVFRSFAPLRERDGKIFGAVEVSQELDSPWSIALGFAKSEIALASLAVLLIFLTTYVLYRYMVYRPIGLLTSAMEKAEAGDLNVQAAFSGKDELGKVIGKFNQMVAALNEMTKERSAYQETLQVRIAEATDELKTKNEQLTEANRELWQMSRKLSETERLAAAGQLAAQFAHEVGTPLNLISGHIQLLRSQSNGDYDGRLDIISEQIERIERIVREMLDRTRLVRGRHEPVDLNDVLNRTFDATAPMLEENGVAMVENLAADLPQISGDPDRLQQVFINLIDNAVDAMVGGGELKISTRLEAGEAIVEFSDNGSGMPEAVRERIFDVLYTTKGASGTGLGLVVVKQIMQEHDGDIDVTSKPGKGSCFRLHFPVKAHAASRMGYHLHGR